MQLNTINLIILVSLTLLISACGAEPRLLEEMPRSSPPGADPDAEIAIDEVETEPVDDAQVLPRDGDLYTPPEPVTTTELGVLALVNDHQETDLQRLDFDCELRSDSAQNIIRHRDGDDGLAGTTDDGHFPSLGALEAVPMVGEWSISQLRGCADHFGYLPTAAEGGLLLMLNDLAETDVDLLDHICGLRSDTAHALIEYRNGDDERPGTDDDDLFDTIWEVEGVYMVGEWSLETLISCAEHLEYVALDASSDEPSTN